MKSLLALPLLLLVGCASGEPMGGPYEESRICIAGLVETGPDVFTVDILDEYRGQIRVQSIEGISRAVAEEIQVEHGGSLEPC